MNVDEPRDKAGNDLPFELEEAQEVDRPGAAKAPDLSLIPPATSPPARPGSSASGKPSPDETKLSSSREVGGVIDARRLRRLQIYVPTMLVLYVIVGWLSAGRGLVWFALAGIGIGVLAAWRQQGEILLGTMAALAGFAACLLAVQFPLLFVIVPTGLIGYIAGIDDRMRNS